MADIEFDLNDGLCVDGVENKHVVMRGLTAGDIIAAEEGSETCYHTTQGPVVLSSPIKAMVIALSRDLFKVSATSKRFHRRNLRC